MLEIRSRSVPRSAERAVALKTKASIPLIANILSNTRAREIACSKAIKGTIPQRALIALKKMGIGIRVVELRRGRPRKHPEKKRSAVLDLLSLGESHKSVSEKLGIPLRTVYWIGKGGGKHGKGSSCNRP
jgi:hypothetical protein